MIFKKIIMRIETRKVDLISWITNINNSNVIKKLEELRDKEDNWWDLLPKQVQNEILESNKHVDKGELYANEEIMKKYKKYLLK